MLYYLRTLGGSKAFFISNSLSTVAIQQLVTAFTRRTTRLPGIYHICLLRPTTSVAFSEAYAYDVDYVHLLACAHRYGLSGSGWTVRLG